eukprot:jgi/Mesvir1/26061/Mv11191-RA.1
MVVMVRFPPCPPTCLQWERTLSVPQFDRGCGTLTSVTISLVGTVNGTAGLENTGSVPLTVTLNLAAALELKRPFAPGSAVLLTAGPVASQIANVGAFDGGGTLETPRGLLIAT